MSERLLIHVLGTDAAPAELPRAGVLVIGSGAKAGLVVDGQGVADVHCAIGKVKGGGWAIKDMGSDFGTLVNGKRVKSRRLAAGDQIVIGSKRLNVIDPSMQPAGGTEDPGTSTLAKLKETRTREPALTDTQRAPLLGGYRIERTLGRGNMGKVFLAVQESLERQVALKVLPPHLAKDRDFVARFQAEARAAAQLNHPNVVVVHDVGEQNGFHYLSMEYMDRGSVEELLAERGRLAYREVLGIAKDAAAGLEYAEQRGIVHQDIKPANLMRNSTGATKIADLGLAVQVSAQEELEQEGGGKKIFGTPHFISPEQLRGEPVDCRSDLYSLGASLYQLLTGRTPFTGDSTREILRGHLKETAKPVRELAPDVPDAAARLVERLLEKDPTDRYPSASVLLAEVERLIALESGVALHAPAQAPPSLRKLAIAGGLVVVALVALLVLDPFGGGSKPAPVPVVNGGPRPVVDGPNREGVGDVPGPTDANGPREDVTEGGGDATQESGDTPNDGDSETTTERDDKEIRLFEMEAELALVRLGQEELTDEARIERLRAFAQQYAGTDSATQAEEQVTQLVNAIAAAAQASAQETAALESVFTELEKAARLDHQPPAPGETLVALNAVAPPQGLEQDPNFLGRRRELQGKVVQKALDFAQERNAEAELAATRGDRAAFENQLRAIVNSLEVPAFEADDAPPGLVDLREARAIAKDRLERADVILSEYAERRRAADALALARALGGREGLEAELSALDFGAARERMTRILAEVPAPDVRPGLESLHAELEQAERFLAKFSRSFAEWRRKTLNDPRSGRTDTAVGVDAGGVKGEDGSWTWPDYAGETRELAKLFQDRLERSYTEQEEAGIFAILETSAVLEALEVASQMFYPEKQARFSEGEAERLTRPFEHVEEWIRTDAERASWTRELEACTLLARTLLATEAEAWSTAVAGTERLLSDYADTLTVLLYSDGTQR